MPVSRTSRYAALAIAGAAVLAYGGLRLSARPAQPASDGALIGKQTDGTYLVPTGQTIRPAGKNITFVSRPVDMALSADGKRLAVMLPNGIRLFDTEKGEFLPDTIKGEHSFGGIVWSSDGQTLYSTGKSPVRDENGRARPEGAVLVTRLDAEGNATEQKPITFVLDSRITPNRQAKDADPCGLALAPDGKTLYVTLFNNGTLAAVDLTSYKPETGAAKVVEAAVGSSPERVMVSADGSKVYVADRGGRSPEAGDTMDTGDPVVVDPETYKVATGTLSVVSAAKILPDPAHAVLKTIQVGLQPADLALSADGKRLFAANANTDTVSVIGTDTDTVLETIPTSPAPGKLAASSPNGLALAHDGSTLYVTLGGDNAVEALTLDRTAGGAAAKTGIAGLIPTAWFPLGVVLSQDGKTLYVANSKGIGSLGQTVKQPRSTAMTPEAGPGGSVQKDGVMGHSVYSVLGSLGVIPVPDKPALAQYTAQVGRDDHFDRMAQAISQKTDPFWSRFKHVILLIKENRTYDQVYGDVPVPAGHVGGDPNLTMFGEKITPNHHALAREFGLFDNLYCSGAISADGHHWLNEAFADDYSERAMNVYPRSYPCCGTDPLVYAGNKFLWQAAMDAGRTFRNYGEFGPLPSMERHSAKEYGDRFTATADLNADVAHCGHILSDMEDSAKGLAQFTSIWFPNDHTSGTRAGAYTPEACLADNDMAIGKLVDAISHSKKYWQDEPTAIFIVEDDAQGGLDHVDGHRTVGLVVSPFNKRGQIFSANYNQLNMLRTIEAILDLKPLNQFDAAALPMRNVFQDKADYRPYTVLNHQIALNQKNPPASALRGSARHWAVVSSQLDFSAPDLADPEKLTEILWHHTHGEAAYPPTDAAR